MIATPKTKLFIESTKDSLWRFYTDSEATMAKIQALPKEYGKMTSDGFPTVGFICINPCYNKKDIVLAMYELIDQAVPTELWNKLAEEHVAPTGTVTLPTDRAEAEKDNATLFSGL